MALVGFPQLNRLQIRNRVQNMLRDTGYPVEAINEALNRVVADINNSGRYRFQMNSSSIVLIQGTSEYNIGETVDGSLGTYTGDIEVIYKSGTAAATPLPKMLYNDALAEGRFVTQGTPQIYSIFTDSIFIDPVPDASANGYRITLIGFRDIHPPSSDFATITNIPARYHETVLVYGVLAEVAPTLQIRSGEGFIPAATMYSRAFQEMVKQEKWQPNVIPQLKRDNRWNGISQVGNVNGVR